MTGCFSCLKEKITCHKTLALPWVPDAPFGNGYHAWCTGCGDIIHNPSVGKECQI